MTAAELLAWARSLGPGDLPVAAELVHLLEQVGPEGSVERAPLVEAASLDPAVAARATNGSGPGLDPVAVLENAGILRRETSPAGPPGGGERLRFDPVLWVELEPRKPEIIEELRDVVRVLQRGGAPQPTTTVVDVSPGGSRLRASGLVKAYRKRKVVNEVAISVAQGEIVALLGPNGAGKTTTFYMIVGLIPPDEGRVELDGVDITETPMFKRARMGIGYLAQEPSIFRKLTVEENVLAILETLDLPRDEERRQLEELLHELSIQHLRESKAYQLSGGERRRLEITRALVQRPKFILLDEPFAGIDPIAVGDIQKIVGELKRRNIGVVISDHNVEQTLEIVDRAYIMYEGGIRVSGSVSELVWNDEVSEIYLGPTLTARMRRRFARPETTAVSVSD